MRGLVLSFLLGVLGVFPVASFADVDAMDCVSVKRDQNGAAHLENRCGTTVTVVWCAVGDDCKGSRYYTNMDKIGAGRERAIGGKGREVAFAACWGVNQSIETNERGGFRCPHLSSSPSRRSSN
jgi:hypothetical protein